MHCWLTIRRWIRRLRRDPLDTRPYRPERAQMTAYPYNRWSHLIGAFVEIRRNNQVFRTGFVDEAMPDSSALWLASDQNHSRILIEAAEGFEVWVESRELEGLYRYRMTAAALNSGDDFPHPLVSSKQPNSPRHQYRPDETGNDTTHCNP